MKSIECINENEPWEETMKFIESHQNWNVAKQEYRVSEAERCQANLSECKIYWRGKYLILEHNDIIYYWDSFPYCFLRQAIELMELDKPARWKTLNKLIEFRQAIRQTEVNCCGYVETLLEGEKMTLRLFQKFMRMARAQDLQHHGSSTF